MDLFETPIERQEITTILKILHDDADQMLVDHEYKNKDEKIGNFSGIKQNKLPGKMDQIIRPYQKFGYEYIYLWNVNDT